MDARLLLKHYIDEEKIHYSDIAVATDINLSTLKNGLYNQKMSFEKFGKIAVVCDFDLEKNILSIADTYKMNPRECHDKLEVYRIAMANRIIHKRIESYVAESKQDTSFAVMCKIQKAAEAADKKQADIKWYEDKPVEKPVQIPVPEELPNLVEAVIKNDGNCASADIHMENENKNTEDAMEEKDKVVVVNKKLGKLDIIRDVVHDMKGMQAVEMASLLQAIIEYRDDNDINHLIDAREYLEIIIKEQENGWQ